MEIQTLKPKKELSYHIPQKLKSQIDSAFAATYTPKNLYKIYFLVYKINSETSFSCNVRKLASFFSLETRQVSHILSTLRTLLIINNDGLFYRGEKSTNYFMLPAAVFPKKEADWNIDYQVKYQLDSKTTPKWAIRYIEDNWNILWKEQSQSSASKPQPKKVKTVLTNDKELNDLKKLVQQLQAENEALRAQLVTPLTVDDNLPTNEPDEIDEDDHYDVPVTPVETNNTLFSINLDKHIKVIYETDLPNDSQFLDYLSSTIKKFPIFYKQGNFVAILNGDSVKIKAA
ncbi:hypothetical protein [Pedobacter sp.]|uniref:hypothetical protein n=1 Tax=Pedobacter sp. TaxID=1411316 RepID=UPI003C68D792